MDNGPPHEDRARALGFGAVAGRYDDARPGYPPAMVVDLLADGPGAVLDVGCGTGKAGRLFLGAGRTVLGVEPDARMAAVARTHGLEVEIGDFETWDPAGRRFDLLVSGTAWHWVDPVAGAAKAAEVLRPGGRIGLFWNTMRHAPDVRAVFEQVYGPVAPELLATSMALAGADTDGPPAGPADDPAEAALAAGPWVGVAAGSRVRYRWTVDYTPEAWLDLVATHSDHLRLEPTLLEELGARLVAALARLGTPVVVNYRTDLLTARRA